MLSLKDVFEGRKPIYAMYRKLSWKFSFLIEIISDFFGIRPMFFGKAPTFLETSPTFKLGSESLGKVVTWDKTKTRVYDWGKCHQKCKFDCQMYRRKGLQ